MFVQFDVTKIKNDWIKILLVPPKTSLNSEMSKLELQYKIKKFLLPFLKLLISFSPLLFFSTKSLNFQVFNMTSILSNDSIHLSNKDTLHKFIQSKTVNDVLQKVKPTQRELLDLPCTSTIEEAFDLLLAQDILSVPIYRSSNGIKEYITIVSALDLLKLLSLKVKKIFFCLCNDLVILWEINLIFLTAPPLHRYH